MTIPTNPRDRRISVVDDTANALAWGRLVKTWATGLNYVDNPYSPPPVTDKYRRPNSFKEFVQQCRDASVGLLYDDGDNPSQVREDDPVSFVMLHGNTDLLVIRLSASEFLKKSEEHLVDPNTKTYEIPAFYKSFLINANADPNQVNTPEKRLDIHAMRVGEYTIAMCF